MMRMKCLDDYDYDYDDDDDFTNNNKKVRCRCLFSTNLISLPIKFFPYFIQLLFSNTV